MDVVVGEVQLASFPLFFHVNQDFRECTVSYLKDIYCQASWTGRCLLDAR